MKVTDNPDLYKTIFEWLRDTYLKSTYRPEGWHLTEFIYCLTKSYWDRVDPMPPTESETLLFASGLGLERVLIPIEYKAKPILEDTIWVSPDFMTNIHAELKTTRTSSKKILAGDFPETWVEQIMGYCYATHQTQYDLGVLCLLGSYNPPFPKLHCFTLEFEPDGLKDFWLYIAESRKPILGASLRMELPPIPQKHCKDWECGWCRYTIRCRAYCLEHSIEWKEKKK